MSGFKMKIKFLRDVSVLDHNLAVVFSAKAGEVRELEQASARRWLRRDAAVKVVAAKPAPKPAAPPNTVEGEGDGADSQEAKAPTKPRTPIRKIAAKE